jgi:leucine-rich repeat protein SHOC2
MISDIEELVIFCSKVYNSNSQYLKDTVILKECLQLQKLFYTYGDDFLSFSDIKESDVIDVSDWGISKIPNCVKQINHPETVLAGKNRLSILPNFLYDYKTVVLLDLTKNRLTDLENIGNMNSIRFLYAGYNRLESIPESLTKLELSVLCLNNNCLKSIPTSIGTIKTLTILKLENNRLKKIPDSITTLYKLESLDFSNNNITHIPKRIGGLKMLKNLTFTKNKIRNIPVSILRCKKLIYLDLDSNRINTLPKNIGKLKSLLRLNVKNNRITKLPPSFKNLVNLIVLTLSGNKIVTLPSFIYELSSLNALDIRNCGLKKVPCFLSDMVELYQVLISGNEFSLSRKNRFRLFDIPHVDMFSNCTCGLSSDSESE